MITNSQTHYQTCFLVESTSEKADAFIQLQRIIYGWIKKLEGDKIVVEQSKDFFFRCDWRNLWTTRASLGTNTFLDGETKAWAMRYAHPDRELGTRRYWFTDVGINFDGKVATVYVRNSFARGQFDLAVDQAQPRTTTPKFVRQILHPNTPLKIYSRSPKFPLRSIPGGIRAGMGHALAEALLDRERRYAILVANGDSPALLREAKSLAGDLAGKSQVFCLERNLDLAEELRNYLPKALQVPFDSIRIFYPLNPENPRPERHRWFHVPSDNYKEQREGILNGLLRNYELEENLPIRNISDVGRLISLSKLKKLIDTNGAESAELAEVQEMFEELAKESEAYKTEAAQWAADYDAKEQELNELKSKQYAKALSVSTSEPSTGIDCRKELSTLPSSLKEVVELQAKIHRGFLAFSPEALKSAEDYTNCSVVDRAWEILNHLGTTLHEIKFGGGEPGNIAERFQERSGYEYAITEGKQSKQDKSIRAMRKLSFEGNEYEIWPHIKFGNEPPKMLRVHFDYDDEKKRIVIGYVGPHMTNASSRSRK